MTGATSFGIEQPKITGYLLNLSHPRGGSKAKFFIGLGFAADDPAQFARAIASHALLDWPGTLKRSQFRAIHELVGPIETPSGKRPTILTVWEVRADEIAWLVQRDRTGQMPRSDRARRYHRRPEAPRSMTSHLIMPTRVPRGSATAG